MSISFRCILSVSLKTSAIASKRPGTFIPIPIVLAKEFFRWHVRFFSRVHFSYFKLLIRLVTSFVEYFFFLSLFFQNRREFGRDCSREAIDGSRPTEFDLTHSESSIYPSCDYLQFATYNWCNSRGRSIPLFDRMPLKLVQNFIDQHGSYILTCPNLYFLCIYLCYYTNERLKFHGRHGLRTTIIEGTIVERFVDFEREREREFMKRA